MSQNKLKSRSHVCMWHRSHHWCHTVRLLCCSCAHKSNYGYSGRRHKVSHHLNAVCESLFPWRHPYCLTCRQKLVSFMSQTQNACAPNTQTFKLRLNLHNPPILALSARLCQRKMSSGAVSCCLHYQNLQNDLACSRHLSKLWIVWWIWACNEYWTQEGKDLLKILKVGTLWCDLTPSSLQNNILLQTYCITYYYMCIVS